MSRSPERMSSYRRHFEGMAAAAPAVYQVRVSSPSPTRRGAARHRSASYSRSGGSLGRRAGGLSNKSRMTSSSSMGALCFGMSMGLGPKLDLDAASAENQEFISTRTGERQEMIVLNDRLAVYIEKVRSLESANKLLEVEIEAMRNRYVKPSGLRQMYEAQLKDLLRTADQARAQKDLALAAKEAMSGQVEVLKMKYEEAVEARKKAELEIEAFRPDVDKVTSSRIALEKQMENLNVQLAFLQRIHKEEVEELMQQVYSVAAGAEMSFGLPDLSSAVRDIQATYDSIAARNLQEMDMWYKTKFQDMSSASTKHVQSVRGVRSEIANYKKDILNKERELEAAKTKNEMLEALIRDTLERHKKDEDDLKKNQKRSADPEMESGEGLSKKKERIDTIQVDLKVMKEKIALLLKEYQELLNIKMSLELEITTYRMLIDSEDSRLGAMVRVMSLMQGPPTMQGPPRAAAAPAPPPPPPGEEPAAPLAPGTAVASAQTDPPAQD